MESQPQNPEFRNNPEINNPEIFHPCYHEHLDVASLADNGFNTIYSKTCLKWPLKKNTKIGFQYRLSLNAGQK